MISPMAANRRIAERTPSPGNCTRNGTCLTHGSQVESRPSSASLSWISTVRVWYRLRSCLDSELLGRRQIQRQPPLPLMQSKRLAWGWIKIVPLQDAVQTIRGLRSLLHQSVAVCHQGTELPHFWRWHPHGRNEIGRQQTRQFNRITGVRFHARSGDQLDCLRMRNNHFCEQDENGVESNRAARRDR